MIIKADGYFHRILKQNNGTELKLSFLLHGFQFSSVAQLCPTLCDPMDYSMLGLPVHHQLLELVLSPIFPDEETRGSKQLA